MAQAVHASLSSTHNDADAALDECGERQKSDVAPRSGAYSITRPTQRPEPTASAYALTVARAALDSIAEVAETNVSDLVTNLARLSNPDSVPRLCGAVDWTNLTAVEGWLVSIVTQGMPLAMILETSPYGEDETLAVLARLIGGRIVTLL
jgi:hypothetical protein